MVIWEAKELPADISSFAQAAGKCKTSCEQAANKHGIEDCL